MSSLESRAGGPAGVSDVEEDADEDWEKRRMDERDRFGLERREDSRSREMGSSFVRVSEIMLVEKDGCWWAEGVGSPWTGSLGVVPGLVARRICSRSSRSWASSEGLASLRPAQETRRMQRSTVGVIPARSNFAKVWACSPVMSLAGGVLGGAFELLPLRA